MSEHYIAHLILVQSLADDPENKKKGVIERAGKRILLDHEHSWIVEPLEQAKLVEKVIEERPDLQIRTSTLARGGPQQIKRFMCFICNIGWLDETKFDNHMAEGKLFEGKEISFEWACGHCSKAFRRLSKLAQHLEAGCDGSGKEKNEEVKRAKEKGRVQRLLNEMNLIDNAMEKKTEQYIR